MDSHPEERRVVGLLRELIVRSGTTPEQRPMDRLFERSLRAVRKAIARRAARQRQRRDET